MSFVGIDFGTTNSSIAVYNTEKYVPETKQLKSGYGAKKEIMRTFLYYTEDGQVLSDNIQASNIANSERSVLSLKRQIMKDPEFTKIIDGVEYTSEQMIADFIGYLLQDAGIDPEDITQLVLSVPTNYTEELKDKMEFAVNLLGISEPWFIDEPVSVLWDHKDAKLQGDVILVFDFGGGTLDLAVMRKSENDSARSRVLPKGFGKQSNHKKGKILAKIGANIGGDDIDEMIIKHFITVGKQNGNPVCDKINLEIFDDEARMQKFRQFNFYPTLKNIAEATKIQLSQHDEVPFFIPTLHPQHDRVGIKGTLSQAQFMDVTKDLWAGIADSLNDLNNALKASGMSLKDIECVFLSGGSSLVPAVADLLEQHMPNARLQFDENMQTSICRGNAIYAHPNVEILVEDHINSAYGIFNHVDQDVVVVIKETAAYPFVAKKRIATTRPNQTEIEIVPMVRKGGDFEPIRKNGTNIFYRLKVRPLHECRDLTRFDVHYEIDRSQKLKISAYDNHFKESVGVYEVSLDELD